MDSMSRPLSTLALLALSSLGTLCGAEPAPKVPLPMTDEGLPGTGPIRRYDWFQQLWSDRRGQWQVSREQDQGALVFLGDSITQGWFDLGSHFPGIKIANRGISGDTTRGVLVRLQEDVLSLSPKGVVMLVGTNDLEDNSAPEVVAGNLRLILAAMQARDPQMPVVLLQVLPSSASMKRPADRIRRLNTLYRTVAADFPQVTLLDTWTLFANPKGDASEEDMPDLLHPNAKGYAKLARALRPVLEGLSLVPAWPDDFQTEPGFSALFDGTSLNGWSLQEGSSPDAFLVTQGRLLAKSLSHGRGRLECAAPPAGDLILRFEFRASPSAQGGLVLRGVTIPCGDFRGAGPFAELAGFRDNDWNAIEITCRSGLAHVTCNGAVLLDALPLPDQGSLSLDNDRGQVEYRRLRLRGL